MAELVLKERMNTEQCYKDSQSLFFWGVFFCFLGFFFFFFFFGGGGLKGGGRGGEARQLSEDDTSALHQFQRKYSQWNQSVMVTL